MKKELSDGEWRLMKRLWENAPLTIAQLTDAMAEETGWTKYTIISLLSRMENKGAIRHEEGGRSKLFYPIWERDEAIQQETRHFLARVFNGKLGSLVNAMVDADALTQEDLIELSDILQRAKRDGAK